MNCLNAIALFGSSGRGINGSVTFHQCEKDADGVWVEIDLHNFDPHQTHAIHIHEYGDEREGCTSLGGHWNPDGTTHGSLYLDMPSHAGDMINNLKSDSNGNFHHEYYDPRLTLKGLADETIFGRSVVIHYGKDDLGLGGINPPNAKIRAESLKTGNAGKRMACAIIGRAKNGAAL